MMYLDIGFFVVGFVVLVLGYVKSKRNILLAGAIALFLSGSLSSFIDGFIDGFKAGREESRQASVVSVSLSNLVTGPTPLSKPYAMDAFS